MDQCKEFHVCETAIIAIRHVSFVCVCKDFFFVPAIWVKVARGKSSIHCSIPSNAVSRASRFFPIVYSYRIRSGNSESRVHMPLIGRNDIMKKTISVYWPLAIVVPLAAAAYPHICGGAASRASQAPLAADQLT